MSGVHDIQPNVNVSLEGQENKILNAMAGLENNGGTPNGPGSGGGSSNSEGSKFANKEDYPGLTAAVGLVTKAKWISAFTDVMSDSKSAGKKGSKVDLNTVLKKSMVPLSYPEKRRVAAEARKKAPPSLKGSGKKGMFTNMLGLGPRVEIENMAMGPDAFKPKGMQATPQMTASLSQSKKLEAQLAHVRRLKRAPYLNSNGTLNSEKLTKDLGRGVNTAEEFYNKKMNHNAIKPQIYKGMGGPPTIAS